MKFLPALFVFLGLLLVPPQKAMAQKADDLIKLSFKQFTKENKSYFALHLKLENNWHIYWKNPGDSGIATEWNFSTKSNSLKISMLEWPAPKLFKEAGDLWTFGYSGEETFFATVETLKNMSDELFLEASFLVCKEICLPAKLNFNFDISNGSIQIAKELTLTDSDQSLFEKLKALPKTLSVSDTQPWTWQLYRLENTPKLRLVLSLREDVDASMQGHIFTPFPSQPINFRHFNLFGKTFIQEIDWDGQYLETPLDLPSDGVFRKSYPVQMLWHKTSKESFQFSLELKNFKVLNQAEWSHLEQNSNTVDATSASTQNATSPSFILMLLFALIGGFILNFMPCVLPIISLKLYGLLHHSKKSKKDILKHHFSYSFGVLLCFWILALAISILKSSGESIGWGFQLQSPSFVWFMILLFFLLSLNLFGLFEFKTPAGHFIGKLRSHHPYIDDFFSGLLAVIVATPCSAPFLGPALTYAFSENVITIFLLFTFMGLGLSLPFIATALFPKTLTLLPKPGAWMNNFKFLMGLALLISVLWLVEVLQSLGNFSDISFMLYLTLLLWFFSLFIYKNEKKFTPLVIFLLTFTVFNTYRSFSLIKHTFSATAQEQASVIWQPWSKELIETHFTNKDIFFVDATAKWCITCQVNKKLVFETQGFSELMKKYQVKTMRLDWTKKDALMFEWLKNHGAVSVPAYFMGKNGKIFFLGETISLAKIEDAINNP